MQISKKTCILSLLDLVKEKFKPCMSTTHSYLSHNQSLPLLCSLASHFSDLLGSIPSSPRKPHYVKPFHILLVCVHVMSSDLTSGANFGRGSITAVSEHNPVEAEGEKRGGGSFYLCRKSWEGLLPRGWPSSIAVKVIRDLIGPWSCN